MIYDNNQIISLAKKFRKAIDKAYNNGDFDGDICFKHFPRGCCGDTCYLLATYLYEKGVESLYVCGNFGMQSHAWLVLKDKRVSEPAPKFWIPSDEENRLIEMFGGKKYDKPVDITKYEESNIENGIIVDLTADQFGEVPVFVGYIDGFHKEFEFDFAHEMDYVLEGRLVELYNIVYNYL